MIGYLGVPGVMVGLPYRGGLDTSSDRPVSFTRTSGGKRKAFVGAHSRREWGVSFDLMASREALGLLEIARSVGEVAWYPADATAGNLLSPQASGFYPAPAGATDAGLVQLPDGTVARSVVSSGTVIVGPGARESVAVRPGEPVTVGAWFMSAAILRGFWRNAAGSSMTNWAESLGSHTGWAWREVTLTPPPGAAFIDLHLAAGARYALPSVSWGNSAAPRPGRGCPKAVVHGLSEALSVIHQGDAYGSVSVTITEVG